MFKNVQHKLMVWFVIFSCIPILVFGIAFRGHVAGTSFVGAAIVSLLLSGIVGFVVAKAFSQPLLFALNMLRKLALGELNVFLPNRVAEDERGQIVMESRKISIYLKEVADFVARVAQGKFGCYPPDRTENDELGRACLHLAQYNQRLLTTINHIAENGSATEVVPLSDNDAVGESLHRMTQDMYRMIARFKESMLQLLEMSQDVMSRANVEIQSIEKLLSSAESTSSSMAEMQASVEEVGMNIEALTASIEATSSSINQMGSSISQVTRNSEKLSEFVETTSGIIAQAVTAMEKMSENAENSKILSSDTMRDASKGQEAMKKMSESVQSISETVEAASEVIQQLEARSDEIGSVLDVIDEIAHQTQLLALNASIIAAQAGEHGKGFAVVADEIKDLANRVSESTKEISTIVKTVQQDSAKAATAMDEGNTQVKEGLKLTRLASDALEKIILGAQWSANVANDIADAIQDQTATNQSIENSIQDVVNVATENTRATKEQEIGASRVMEAVAKMTALADQVHRATIEQTKGSAEVINATEEMSVLVRNSVRNTQQLMEAARELSNQVEQLETIN